MRYYHVWIRLPSGVLHHVETVAGLREDVEGYVLEGQRLPHPRNPLGRDGRSFVRFRGRDCEVVMVEELGVAQTPVTVG